MHKTNTHFVGSAIIRGGSNEEHTSKSNLFIVLSLSIVIEITTLSRENIQAATDTTSGLTYTITGDVATITDFNTPAGFSGTLVIPNTLSEVSVISIRDHAFDNCPSLTGITK